MNTIGFSFENSSYIGKNNGIDFIHSLLVNKQEYVGILSFNLKREHIKCIFEEII